MGDSASAGVRSWHVPIKKACTAANGRPASCSCTAAHARLSRTQRDAHLAAQHKEASRQGAVCQRLWHHQRPLQPGLAAAVGARSEAGASKAKHAQIAQALGSAQQAIGAWRQAAACAARRRSRERARAAQQAARASAALLRCARAHTAGRRGTRCCVQGGSCQGHAHQQLPCLSPVSLSTNSDHSTVPTAAQPTRDDSSCMPGPKPAPPSAQPASCTASMLAGAAAAMAVGADTAGGARPAAAAELAAADSSELATCAWLGGVSRRLRQRVCCKSMCCHCTCRTPSGSMQAQPTAARPPA